VAPYVGLCGSYPPSTTRLARTLWTRVEYGCGTVSERASSNLSIPGRRSDRYRASPALVRLCVDPFAARLQL